jgi:CheY-like chemotaxis protein
LSVVYGIVQRHNGFINVESYAGKGTTFTLYFTSLKQERSAGENGNGLETMEEVRGDETILLVDDEADVLDIHGEYMASLGYHVLKASGCDEALLIARDHTNQIDLVILDMAMPGKDGRETFRLLRLLDPSLRVAFASGYADERKFADVLHEGALGLLKKPFSSDISRKLKELLQKLPAEYSHEC